MFLCVCRHLANIEVHERSTLRARVWVYANVCGCLTNNAGTMMWHFIISMSLIHNFKMVQADGGSKNKKEAKEIAPPKTTTGIIIVKKEKPDALKIKISLLLIIPPRHIKKPTNVA